MKADEAHLHQHDRRQHHRDDERTATTKRRRPSAAGLSRDRSGQRRVHAAERSGTRRGPIGPPGPACAGVAFGFVVLFFVVSVVLPAIMLVQVSFIRFIGLDVFRPASYTLDNWPPHAHAPGQPPGAHHSLVMSIVATTVGMVIYSLVSYVVTRNRYKGRRLLDLAAWVPWAVPSLVLGLGILWPCSFRRSPSSMAR